MALNVEMGQLTIPTSTDGTQQISHSVTDLAALIFWGGLSTGSAVDEDAMMGFSNGTTEYSVGRWHKDNASAGDNANCTAGPKDVAIFLRHDTTVMFSAPVIDITSSYFELDWATIAVAAQSKYLNWIAIGGVDVDIGYLTLDTSTGNQSDSGLSFEGDFGIFLHTDQTSFSAYSQGTALWGVGFAEDASNEGVTCDYNRTSTGTTIARSYINTALCHAVKHIGVASLAEFVSWNADGFTINITDAPPSAYVMPYLVLDTGGRRSVGNFTQPTSTGEQTVEGSLGFDAAGSLFQGIVSPADTGACRFFFGAGVDASNQGCLWAASRGGVTPTISDQRISSTRCIEHYQEGTPTEWADASYVDQASGEVKVDWDTADATERRIIYAILGEGVAPSGIVPFRRRIEGY